MKDQNMEQANPLYSDFDELTVREAPWWAQLLARFKGADLYPLCVVTVVAFSDDWLTTAITTAGIVGLALIRALSELSHGTNRKERQKGSIEHGFAGITPASIREPSGANGR